MGKRRVTARKFHSDALQAPDHADAKAKAAGRSKPKASRSSQQELSDDDDIEDDEHAEQQAQPDEPDEQPADGDASEDEQQAAAEPGPSSKRQRLLEMLPNHIDEQKLKQLAASLPPKADVHRQHLELNYQQQYSTWRFQLRQGFNLLFYGFGSKRKLLEHFATTTLTDGGVIAVAGYHATATAKQILSAALHALTHRSHRTASCQDLLTLLAQERPDRHLYILIHNIDGPGLRAPEEQQWLSALAALPHIHLVASVDHVNAALLWDKQAAARCRWAWHDATIYAPYAAETLDTPYVLAGAYQQTTRRGAGTVLQSLVTNAREVFRVLANHLLEDPQCEGVTFQHLYRMCRERFLVSSEQSLRQHLTEFLDHDLVRQRAGPAGDLLSIPMEQGTLQQVLAQMEGGG